MTRGTVKVKLRPIRLAFLVKPKDKKSLQQAIEINRFIWTWILGTGSCQNNPEH